MDQDKKLRAHVRAALGRALRCDPDRLPIRVEDEDGVVTLHGEVDELAAKRRALKEVAALPDVRWVADGLLVKPAARMSDHAVVGHVKDALLVERAFDDCAVRLRERGAVETVRTPAGTLRGAIEVSAQDGRVTLDGSVQSLAHRRLAGLLAWWVPGSRDVVNTLEVVPAEEDSDDEITEAVRLALESDPLVDAVAIGVKTERATVTLFGTATSEEEKAAAERDAWFTLGVDDVDDRIQVVPPTATAP